MAETPISDPNGTTDLDFKLGELLREIEKPSKVAGWTMQELIIRTKHSEEWISKHLIRTGLLSKAGEHPSLNVAGRMCWKPVYAPTNKIMDGGEIKKASPAK